ncbi:MAG: acetyltransferase [Alphaproteobacteria bacterium]|nr:acetyltransferase [Alphaproteobacteria bacterium]NCQ89128.1 acetyltransferase [Alphaproteobacteria bacterium]NCT08232.1 acetyltransferase [Alphaproteobacteria bacterium]
MPGIIFIGGFIELEELCTSQNLEVYGYIDSVKRDNLKASYLGTDAQARGILAQYQDATLHLTPEKPAIREKLAKEYATLNLKFSALIHQSCIISPSSNIGDGSVLQAGVIISSSVKIKRHVKINSGACVAHDVDIADFVTISPRATICGHVHIAQGAYIGANTVVLGGLRIGKNAIIGAGAVVTKDVPDNVTVIGNPAKIKEASA